MALPAGESSAIATLDLLQDRLRHVEFLVTGACSADVDGLAAPETRAPPLKADETVQAQLRRLESDLRKLSARSGLVRDVLSLYSQFPELFAEDDGSLAAAAAPTDYSTLESIVLAHAASFPETAARLRSLHDLAVPAATTSATLVALQPQLDEVRRVQERQEREVQELRARSARLLERWVDTGVVGLGQCWAEWEERVRTVEREVRREEARRLRQGQ